jgi:hypothetical protein
MLQKRYRNFSPHHVLYQFQYPVNKSQMYAVTYCLYTESSSTARALYCGVSSVNPLTVVWAAPEGIGAST